MWQVGIGLGNVVNAVTQAVRRFAHSGCLSDRPGMGFLREFALNTDNPIFGRWASSTLGDDTPAKLIDADKDSETGRSEHF